MNEYRPIDCGLHDYIEISCMRRYRVRIGTPDHVVVGTAVTTETDADKQEWLLLEEGTRRMRVRLDKINSLEPLTPDAAFSLISFRDRPGPQLD